MKKLIYKVLFVAALYMVTSCGNSQGGQNSEVVTEKRPEEVFVESVLQSESDSVETTKFPTDENVQGEEENAEMKMYVQIGSTAFTATLEDNVAVNALMEMMEKEPVVIRMNDYSGFEKVGALGKPLPTDNSQITTQAGDIVLYQGNQIVVFYGSNSWSYTRIGRIDDLTGWEEALGDGDVTVILSLED